MRENAAEPLRIDKLLWFLRFAKSRSLAQTMVEAGHIRLEGRRISRSSTTVQAGQHLVIPIGDRIEVIRIVALPQRRGPASEAQSCYERISPAAETQAYTHEIIVSAA
jgi:ribosome-associated heat shock protein Hsp15